MPRPGSVDPSELGAVAVRIAHVVVAHLGDHPGLDGVEPELGRDAVRAAWDAFFAASPTAHFDGEEVIVAGDRCIVRWIYTWQEDGGGRVHGVDVIRVRDGKVAEKFAYVKG